MTSTTDSTREAVQPTAAAPEPADEIVLQAQLSPRWALAPRHLGMLAFWCVLFMVLNHLPLRGTDIWGHAAYGRWMLEHRELPAADPFQPLAEGMRVVDNAWLAQVVFAWVERWGGGEALSAMFALCVWGGVVLLSRAAYLQSGRMLVAFVAALLAFVVGWSRMTTIRPENFGYLLFGAMLWQLARSGWLSREPLPLAAAEEARRRPWGAEWCVWVAVPLMLLLWANLHGTFVVGLATLGCLAAGRAIDAAWRTRSFAATLADPEVRRSTWLLLLSTIATLVNPYGLDLHLSTLWFAANDNLQEVLEWQPLSLVGIGGREFTLSILLLLVVLRHSRRRVAAHEVLWLGLFGLATASQLRMINWYAGLLAISLAPHLAELWNRWAAPPEVEPVVEPLGGFELTRGRSWRYSLVALLLIWVAFVLSPVGDRLVGGSPRTPERLYDSMTPLRVAEHLREHPPRTMVFNPQWWGDWLVWSGPPALRPFMTTNLHLAPAQVWRDYHRILAAGAGWQGVLDRYRVDTLVIDKERQATLTYLVRRSDQWRVTYEDDQAVVAERRAEAARQPSGGAELIPDA